MKDLQTEWRIRDLERNQERGNGCAILGLSIWLLALTSVVVEITRELYRSGYLHTCPLIPALC